MKKIIISILIFVAATCTVRAQNAKVDASGNYTALAPSASKEPGKETGKTFTDGKGTKYPVLISSKGKLYYIRTSKAGNEYKAYLKVD